jgi:uncharacterized protein
MLFKRSARLRGTLVMLGFLAACLPTQAQQPKIRTLNEQELVDMMMGGSIQASRSSNTPSSVTRVKQALAQGKKFQMIALEDVPDDWTVVSPGGVGGGGAWQYVRIRTTEQNLPRVPNGNVMAADALSKYTGKKINAVIRSEADGATIEAMLLAADLGVPVVDGCMVGRARPEIQQQLPAVLGISAAPAAYVSRWGDTIILAHAVDEYRVEDIARALAVGSAGSVSGVDTMISGRDVKRSLVPGALSQAILLGRSAREAVEQHKDPIQAILKIMHGYKLFHGVVAEDDTKGERGFTWSVATLEGVKEDEGHTYKIWNKNENIVAWYDGKVDATAPDTLMDLDPRTGDAHNGPTLGAFQVGAEIVMVGWPADTRWRLPKGIEFFGPRHFGFDFDYVPIEELQKARRNPAVN